MVQTMTQKKAGFFEFYKDKKNEYRWRFVSPSGQQLGKASRGFSSSELSKIDAERHGYRNNPEGIGSGDRWQFFKNKKGEYRWRRLAANGEIISRSIEGFADRSSAKANARFLGYRNEEELKHQAE